MEALFILCGLPLLWPFAAKLIWGRELVLLELLASAAIGVVVAFVGWSAGHYAQMADEQIINGQVTSKTKDRVSCEHSYSCNCRESCSGSGSTRSCSTTCDTCYMHTFDYSWILHSDIGERVEVERVDRQGAKEPARYARAKPGDPFSVSKSYLNYILGAPHSLFHGVPGLERFAADIPAYPGEVYDLHYVKRVLSTRVAFPEIEKFAWNELLAQKLKVLGPEKEVNIVVVLSGHGDQAFGEALRQAWLGGKKNDVIVVLGVPQYPKISWVQVHSWTDVELFKVKLRDALLDLPEAAAVPVMDLIESHVRERFVRKPMKDFEYLEYEVELPAWLWSLLVILSLGAGALSSFFFSRNTYRASH
jgi:hypothetical protein